MVYMRQHFEKHWHMFEEHSDLAVKIYHSQSQTSNTEIGECVAVHSEGIMGFSWREKENSVNYVQVP
jgi:hypothetical protein